MEHDSAKRREQDGIDSAHASTEPRQKATRSTGALDAVRALGEYLYRRGEAAAPGAAEPPSDPEAVLQQHARLVVAAAGLSASMRR